MPISLNCVKDSCTVLYPFLSQQALGAQTQIQTLSVLGPVQTCNQLGPCL